MSKAGKPLERPFRVIDGEGYWAVAGWTGTPINLATHEHDDLRWVTLDELERLLLAHPSYRELFRAVLLAKETN